MIFLLFIASFYGTSNGHPSMGLVVEKVTPGSGADLAGVEEGDVIYAWERNPSNSETEEKSQGALSSPFDLQQVTHSQAPLGDMTIRGEREGKDVTFNLQNASSFDIEVRPTFDPSHEKQYDEAKTQIEEENVEQAIHTFQDIATNLIGDEETARKGIWLLSKMGETYAEANDWDSARSSFDQAHENAKKLKDPMVQASLFEKEGHVYGSHQKMDEAQEAYQSAIDLIEEHQPQSVTLGSIYKNLGDLYYQPGHFHKTYELWKESLDHYNKAGTHNLNYAGILNKMARFTLDTGSLREAEVYLQRAYQIAATDQSSQIYKDTLYGLGRLAESNGETTRARLYLSKLLKNDPNTRSPKDEVRQLLSRAKMAKASNRLDDAYGNFEEANQIIRDFNLNPIERAEVLFEMGDIARQEAKFDAAETHLIESIGILMEHFPKSPLIPSVYHAMGKNLQDRSDAKGHHDLYGKALCLFDQSKNAIDELIAVWREDGDHNLVIPAQYDAFYKDHIQLLVTTNQTAPAFNVLESYRSQKRLSFHLAQQDVNSRTLRKQLEKVRTEIDDLRFELIRGSYAEHESTITDGPQSYSFHKLEILKDREKDLTRQLETRQKREEMEPLTVKETQKALANKQYLLSYLALKDKLLVFALSKDQKERVYTIPVGSKELEQKIKALRRYMTSPESPTARKSMDASLQELSQLLITPLKSELANAKRLIILPDGPLNKLPFAALKNADGQYLAQTHSMSIADSATFYKAARKKQRAKENLQWLGISDPTQVTAKVNPEAMQRFNQALNKTAQVGTTRSPSYAPLPYSRIEIKRASRGFQEKTSLSGKRANEKGIRRALYNADVVHFACHGATISEDKGPALILNRDAGTTRQENDGFFHAKEIKNLDLDTRLVVLSACETGLTTSAPSSLSLAQAFRQAGAENVVASLWRVSDLSTTVLMDRFYNYLHENLPIDKALHLAQRDILESKAGMQHPFYWASFQVYGNATRLF